MSEEMLFIGGCADGERDCIPPVVRVHDKAVAKMAGPDRLERLTPYDPSSVEYERSRYERRNLVLSGISFQVFAEWQMSPQDVVEALIAKYPKRADHDEQD